MQKMKTEMLMFESELNVIIMLDLQILRAKVLLCLMFKIFHNSIALLKSLKCEYI